VTGFAFVTSPCFSCHRVFSYNPVRVPSIRVQGNREPVCLQCMTLANRRRKEMGMEPHFIYPDAYEPVDEDEL